MKLLSRDDFRNSVFKRDNNLCVICKRTGKDAHHILERRLFPDGGYYIDNGATLCEIHHIAAEETVLSCFKIREAAKIKTIILPPHLYNDNEYDKWGNIVLSNGKRLKGELFPDLSVQKILTQGKVLSLFLDYVKYPRTFHLPWSPGVTDKDKIQTDLSQFKNKEVIITEKMDGENTTMYHNYIHARSLDSRHHSSRSWIKQYHSSFSNDIPINFRLCGENLYAKHSIHYKNLRSYFYLFGIWNNESNVLLNWKVIEEYASLLNLELPNIFYKGMWDEKHIQNITIPNNCEGYVLRITDSIPMSQFLKYCLKYVRAEHVQTNQHWMNNYTTKNEIISSQKTS